MIEEIIDELRIYDLPDEMLDYIKSCAAILGLPEYYECQDGYFIQVIWAGENELRGLECFIYDEDNIEFVKLEVGKKKEVTEDSLIDLKEWLDEEND